MKKLFFSLVALTAFSFTTMANEISEIKEKPSSEKKAIEKPSVETVNLAKPVSYKSETPCFDLYRSTYLYLRDMGFTHQQSNSLALSVHANCVKQTY